MDRETRLELDRLAAENRELRQLLTNLPVRFASPAASPPFLARLTASTLRTGHGARWDYTFVEIQLTATVTPGYQDKTGGRTGTAIDLAELAHIAEPASGTAWYLWGVQSHADAGGAYPAGFGVRPVGGGGTTGTHKVDQVVTITPRAADDGSTIYTFERTGSHDGTCTG